jgi:hypothetical protein
MSSRYHDVTHDDLAELVLHLQLAGHLIDRAAFAHTLGLVGQEETMQVIIEEDVAATPIYHRRMQRALNFESTDVATFFKGIQLEILAPPQYMDFEFTVHGPSDGEFVLKNCGALLDFEPFGEEMVRSICHDVEDPTFDGTALATNPRMQCRPIHRPPRRPVDREPHCHWTVKVDENYPAVQPHPHQAVLETHHVAHLVLDGIDPAEDGLSDYAGPLVDNIDYHAFSHSALVRIADELVIQMHLLTQSWQLAMRKRADAEAFRRIVVQSLTGHAGITAEKIHQVLGLPRTMEAAARVLELHPLFNPYAYVNFARDGLTLTITKSPAHDDNAWISFVGPQCIEPLQAAVRAVDPHFDVEVTGTETDWTMEIVQRGEAAKESDDVGLIRLSNATAFQFERRRSLPLSVK